MLRTGPWEPWEYQVLHEEDDLGTTALRLSRDVVEVSRKTDLTFAEWYRRHRCDGSPWNPRRCLRLSEEICEKDFADIIEFDEVERHARDALTHCFARFDHTKGCPDISVEDRFLRFFKGHLRKRLHQERRDARDRSRPNATLRYLKAKAELDGDEEGTFWNFARHSYHEARDTLEGEVREFVRLRIDEGLGMNETSARMRVPRSYLRRFGGDRLPEIIRQQIRRWTQALARRELDRLVDEMDSNFLDEGEIAQLLCIEIEVVVDALRRAMRAAS